MEVYCRRCGYKLKDAKRAAKGIGRKCEIKERKEQESEAMAEVRAAGYDGEVQRQGIQLMIPIQEGGKTT